MDILVDKSWLVDSVTLAKATLDDWQKVTYVDEVILDNVRVDLTKSYSGSGDSRSIVANATVFMYGAFTTNFFAPDDSWLNARLIYNGHEYLVKDISIYHGIKTKDVYSVELQVI